ncbi:LOW QUALITY PROTEIN: uncharacterized protein LOC142087668 [Calonectris borealis]|uniref:LOW QUALITY PROTEIN: uncharacterized protein LOC142087668 n=1 Tax=Calonectris borealis TaxID=1323832 RepID=UPI003F4B831F
MFIYIKQEGESPSGHPMGACSPGTGGTHHGLAGWWARSGLCDCCQGLLLPSATAALPADDQSFLANSNCAVLRLLSYVRRMVGVPDCGEPWLRCCSSPLPWQQHQHFVPSPVGCRTGSPWRGCSGEVGGPQLTMPAAHRTLWLFQMSSTCVNELGTPKLLFRVSLSERASEFLRACRTYCVCRVEFRVPGTEGCVLVLHTPPGPPQPSADRGPSAAR